MTRCFAEFVRKKSTAVSWLRIPESGDSHPDASKKRFRINAGIIRSFPQTSFLSRRKHKKEKSNSTKMFKASFFKVCVLIAVSVCMFATFAASEDEGRQSF